MGVTKETIKIVLFLGTHEQQDTARNSRAAAPVDHATNQPAYIEDSYPDWEEVLDHSFNCWGRKFEFVTVDVTAGGRGRAACRCARPSRRRSRSR